MSELGIQIHKKRCYKLWSLAGWQEVDIYKLKTLHYNKHNNNNCESEYKKEMISLNIFCSAPNALGIVWSPKKLLNFSLLRPQNTRRRNDNNIVNLYNAFICHSGRKKLCKRHLLHLSAQNTHKRARTPFNAVDFLLSTHGRSSHAKRTWMNTPQTLLISMRAALKVDKTVVLPLKLSVAPRTDICKQPRPAGGVGNFLMSPISTR